MSCVIRERNTTRRKVSIGSESVLHASVFIMAYDHTREAVESEDKHSPLSS